MAGRRADVKPWLGVLLAMLSLALAVPFSLAGCLSQALAGPPLVVLRTTPHNGGYLPFGGVLSFEFNFPVDPEDFVKCLTVSPSCQLEIRATDSFVEIVPVAAIAGKAYRFEVGAGLAGVAGQVLERSLGVVIVVMPEGMEPPPGQEEPADGGPQGDWPVLGCRLELEGSVVGGCDLPGEYEVPRFDLIRLFWPASTREADRPPVALLALQSAQTFREVPATVTQKPRFTEVALQEQVRTGEDYLFVVREQAVAAIGEPATDLWRLSVRGSPYLQVWSVDIGTGKTAPVGQLALGFEARMLLPGPEGGLYAVGTPGGLTWEGLEVVQALNRNLSAVGQPIAVYREVNVLHRQVDTASGTLVAVSPLCEIPPLPDGLSWAGHRPASPPVTGDGPGPAAGAGSPGAALVALRGTGFHTLMWDTGNAGEFMSGPAMSPQRDAVAFSLTSFGEDVTVGAWRVALPKSWAEQDSVAADVFPVRLAHNTYESAFTGEYLYSSGTAWASTDEVWWDIYVDEGAAEVWRLDPSVTSRELIRSDAGTPLVSPDGRYALCKVAAGAVLIRADGSLAETVMGSYEGATWLPDSSAVLLVGSEGIMMLPVDGRAVRIVSFAARPGLFVGPGEYWFVSDRRL